MLVQVAIQLFDHKKIKKKTLKIINKLIVKGRINFLVLVICTILTTRLLSIN